LNYTFGYEAHGHWKYSQDFLISLKKTLQSLASQCDVICLCLSDDKDVVELLHSGLLGGLQTGKVLVNHGTGAPGESRRLAGELEKRGIFYLDAPVSGGRAGALARTLTTMVGGELKGFEAARAIFETFSNRVALLGPSGSGQMAKLLNNALVMSNLQNSVEVFNLGKSVGMDLVQLHEVISASSGASTVLRAINTDISLRIASHLQCLMRKDVAHFVDAMHESGLNVSELHRRCLAGAGGLAELVSQLSVTKCVCS